MERSFDVIVGGLRVAKIDTFHGLFIFSFTHLYICWPGKTAYLKKLIKYEVYKTIFRFKKNNNFLLLSMNRDINRYLNDSKYASKFA